VCAFSLCLFVCLCAYVCKIWALSVSLNPDSSLTSSPTAGPRHPAARTWAIRCLCVHALPWSPWRPQQATARKCSSIPMSTRWRWPTPPLLASPLTSAATWSVAARMLSSAVTMLPQARSCGSTQATATTSTQRCYTVRVTQGGIVCEGFVVKIDSVTLAFGDGDLSWTMMIAFHSLQPLSHRISRIHAYFRARLTTPCRWHMLHRRARWHRALARACLWPLTGRICEPQDGLLRRGEDERPLLLCAILYERAD
jgi:hypothetical protein